MPTADQRVVINCVSWSNLERQLRVRGDTSGPRIAYLDGALELMSPSKDHERIGRLIGTLVEIHCSEADIELTRYGSWTLKQRFAKAGAEPDECFVIGPDQSKKVPDLVVEVVWTHGGVDKLEIYRRLGVPEVWVWSALKIEIYRLQAGQYERTAQSAVLPGLDVELLCSLLALPTSTQAIRAFRQALTRSRRPAARNQRPSARGRTR